jgi:integrase
LTPGNDYLTSGFRADAHYVGLQDVWERIRAKADLKDVRIHDLRHTFAAAISFKRFFFAVSY